jgi:hypothetical protein
MCCPFPMPLTSVCPLSGEDGWCKCLTVHPITKCPSPKRIEPHQSPRPSMSASPWRRIQAHVPCVTDSLQCTPTIRSHHFHNSQHNAHDHHGKACDASRAAQRCNASRRHLHVRPVRHHAPHTHARMHPLLSNHPKPGTKLKSPRSLTSLTSPVQSHIFTSRFRSVPLAPRRPIGGACDLTSADPLSGGTLQSAKFRAWGRTGAGWRLVCQGWSTMGRAKILMGQGLSRVEGKFGLGTNITS